MFCLPILIGATFVHLNNGWLFSAEGGGWEFPVSLSIIALAIIFMGSGNRINLKFNPLNTFLPTQLQKLKLNYHLGQINFVLLLNYKLKGDKL